MSSVVEPSDEPALLSATLLTQLDDPTAEQWRALGEDQIFVVFSTPIDATTLAPGYFLVIAGDERRALPARVVLDPANEADELRGVTLEGAFGDGEVAAIDVIGPLHDIEGRSLEGLTATVDAPSVAPRVVDWSYLTPAEGRCASAGAVVRLWWSRPVSPKSSEAVEGLTAVALEVGGAASIVGVDDVEPTAPLRDHVVDLCLAEAGEVRSVTVDADAFE